MARKLTSRQLILKVMRECSLPDPSGLSEGAIVYSDGVIRHELRFVPDKFNANYLGWVAVAEDEALSSVMAKFGGIGVEIWRPTHSGQEVSDGYSYRWPGVGDGLDLKLVNDVNQFGSAAVGFVRDRGDLARVLLAQENVKRGLVWAHLPKAAAPARLVKSLILARVMKDADLEREIMEVIRSRGELDITWVPGEPYLFRQAVADWAKRYASAAPVDISDLVRLRKRRFAG